MSACIIAAVEAFEVSKKNIKHVSGYPTLDITDCSSKIYLDFSFHNEAGMKKAIKKAQLFRSVVDGFVEALEKEAELYNQKKNEVVNKTNDTSIKSKNNR